MKLPDDPFILELLPEFLDTWIEDLNGQYLILVQTKNEQELYRMGHTIKGSCAQFGLEDVSKMGIELMGFARAHEWGKALAIREIILKSIIEMKQYIQSL
ncbi:MAG: Hpt domain-containing protein [Bacteroidetes bacterium]|nr:Hpt domain-containing protein [Bacteroidota bacterium]